MKTIREIIDLHGGQTKVSKLLGVELKSVWLWCKKNRIPKEKYLNQLGYKSETIIKKIK